MGTTVLIVDDHASFRAAARALLDAGGFDVVGEATDAATALVQARRLRPAVVLLDVQLPDGTGFEVARALERLPEPPAVVLTSTHARGSFAARIEDVSARGLHPQGRAERPGPGGARRMTTPRWLTWLLAVATVALSVIAVYVLRTSDHAQEPVAIAVLGLGVSWAFAAGGTLASIRRPSNPVGLLMSVYGLTWALTALPASDDPALHTFGAAVHLLHYGVLLHLLVAFPSGRIESAFARRLVTVGYAYVVLMPLAMLLVGDHKGPGECVNCPGSAIQIVDEPVLTDAVAGFQNVTSIGILLVIAGVLIARWRAATPPARRVLAPVLATGILAILSTAISIATANVLAGVSEVCKAIMFAAFAAVAIAFLVGLLRSHLARGGVARLVVDLADASVPDGLRTALVRALGDPDLELIVPPPSDPPVTERAQATIEHDGEPLAVVVHDPVLREDPELLDAALGAAALTLVNRRLAAERRARLDELEASRARLVEAEATARRRLERNLHDGAQQRLVALKLQLSLARAKLDADPAAADAIIEAGSAELTSAIDDLRELANGIHPAILTNRGLPAALEDLADRSPVPVAVSAPLDERLPEPVEAAAYFVASEALANVAKYAHANRTEVTVARENGTLEVAVRDDGVGGADPARGSGLRGLADRLSALDGRLSVASPDAGGTEVRAVIPCA